MRKVRSKLTYSNVIATIALFLALGGGAYAAATAPKNSVTSRSIKDGQVKTQDLANGAVTTKKLKNGAVTLNKLAPNSVNGLTNIEDGTVTGADILENTLHFGCASPNIQAPNNGPYVVGTDGFCAFVMRPGSGNPSSWTWSAATAACSGVVGDSTLATPAQIEQLDATNGGSQGPLPGTTGIWTPDPSGANSVWTVGVGGDGHINLFTSSSMTNPSSGPVVCVYQPASKNG